jgi:hypothetical protein
MGRPSRLCAVLFVVAVGACSERNGGDSGPSAPVPTVTATNPASGATDVDVATVVTVTFSAPMNTETLNASTFLQSGTSGIVSGSANTAEFKPAGALACGTSYTVTITTGARSLAGVPLAADHSWAFTTRTSGSIAGSRVAFLTSVTGTGDLSSWADAGGRTGLAAADAVCQARASAAGLAGEFRAWLSDDNDDAYCRIHNLTGKKAANCGQATLPVAAGPWVRTDGHPFAAAIDDLVDAGKVYAPVRYDEFGAPVLVGSPDPFYFTGTREDGTLASVGRGDPHCGNWTDRAGGVVGGVDVGSRDGTTQLWTSGMSTSCHHPRPLLCLQTGKGPGLPCISGSGKRAFVTSVEGSGNLASWPEAGGRTGIAAGDAICSARAAAIGLGNASRFKAWLSTSSVDAKDHITSNGPWVRLDGVTLADSKADLTDGSLFTAISLTETGIYVSSHPVWTGTGAMGVRAGGTCDDWAGSAASLETTAGNAALANSGWSRFWPQDLHPYPQDCSQHDVKLYCLED